MGRTKQVPYLYLHFDKKVTHKQKKKLTFFFNMTLIPNILDFKKINKVISIGIHYENRNNLQKSSLELNI